MPTIAFNSFMPKPLRRPLASCVACLIFGLAIGLEFVGSVILRAAVKWVLKFDLEFWKSVRGRACCR